MKAIELFSGAGGMALGISKAGFSTELLIDNDQRCITTLLINQKLYSHFYQAEILKSNIDSYDYSNLAGDVALLAAGPPCQPFSRGGKKAGRSDARNMFPYLTTIINTVRPKSFLIENVQGIRGEKFRNYLEYIRLQLTHSSIQKSENRHWNEHYLYLQKYHNSHGPSESNYKVSIHWVNSADYGVPQHRERVFIVGFRSDIDAPWAFPAPTHSKTALLWDKFRNHSYWDRNKVVLNEREIPDEKDMGRLAEIDEKEISELRPWKTVREAVGDLANLNLKNVRHHEIRSGAKIYPGHTGSSYDSPAKTIKAGVHGVPGGENMVRFKDGSVRYFTIRELARLQSFPDNYEFSGSWSQMMKQIGNAVPVRLSEIVAKSIKSSLPNN